MGVLGFEPKSDALEATILAKLYYTPIIGYSYKKFDFV